MIHPPAHLRPDRIRSRIRIGESIYRRTRVLQHGRPQVRQRRVLFRGHAVLAVRQAFKASASQQARHVGIPVSRSQPTTVVDEAVVEQRATVRIERVFGRAKLVDEAGIHLHPLLGPLQVELMQRNVGAIVRKCVCRGGDPHALKQTGVRHAVGHHAGSIGLPGSEDHLEHGLDLRLTLHSFRWPLLGRFRIRNVDPLLFAT